MENSYFKQKLELYAEPRNFFYFNERMNAFHVIKMFRFPERINYLNSSISRYNELESKNRLKWNLETTNGNFLRYATSLKNDFEERLTNQKISDELRQKFYDECTNIEYLIKDFLRSEPIDFSFIKDTIQDYISLFSSDSIYFLEELIEYIKYKILFNPYGSYVDDKGYSHNSALLSWLKLKHEFLKKKASLTEIYIVKEELKLKYTDNLKVINVLYNKLYQENLINIEKEDFILHFFENVKSKKMQWLGSEAEFVHLFSKLKLVNDNLYISLVNHFVNNKGNSFNNKQLSVTFTKLLDSYNIIDNILSDINKFKS